MQLLRWCARPDPHVARWNRIEVIGGDCPAGAVTATAAAALCVYRIRRGCYLLARLECNVEHIGLKTTRIRSLSGEQIIFSNADLLNSRLRNYGRMYERRVDFPLGVTYQTPRDKLELIPKILREAIETHGEQVRFDRCHFKDFGTFSINFETVYYVASPDYNLYMDIQQAINLAIHKRFEEEKIDFAYPTQTLFVEGAKV